MPHPHVIGDLPHMLVELCAWGRDPKQGWWGLAMWSVRMMDDDGLRLGGWTRFSAWMPASTLHRSSDPWLAEQYRAVVRLDLPADQAMWPSAAERHDIDCEHLGVITTPISTPTLAKRPRDERHGTGT